VVLIVQPTGGVDGHVDARHSIPADYGELQFVTSDTAAVYFAGDDVRSGRAAMLTAHKRFGNKWKNPAPGSAVDAIVLLHFRPAWTCHFADGKLLGGFAT
jgi:hypothetical protein